MWSARTLITPLPLNARWTIGVGGASSRLYTVASEIDKRHFSFVFVAFADKGNELVGSKFFADHMEAAGAHDVRAMINLDALGLSPTKIWTAHSDKELVQTLIKCVYMLKLPASQVDITAAGNSDSDPLLERRSAADHAALHHA